jgi:hypothetical protein
VYQRRLNIPQGLHAKDIAAASKTDSVLLGESRLDSTFNCDWISHRLDRRLARILRLLATHNIFREVKPNVFANNRISSALDKGKSPSVLFAK